ALRPRASAGATGKRFPARPRPRCRRREPAMKRALALLLLTAASAAQAATIAITNAEVHTLGRAGILHNATVLIRDERIEAVGVDVAPPAGAQVVDARGKVVTP